MWIRLATEADSEEIIRLDAVARADADRRAFVRESIAGGRCFVCTDGGELVGYGVLEHSFYRQGFVAMLYVHHDHRRRGVGTRLMGQMESGCRTRKIWSSTNLSNLPMQSLLSKLDYRLSGVIGDLDPHDPEIVYVKVLDPEGA